MVIVVIVVMGVSTGSGKDTVVLIGGRWAMSTLPDVKLEISLVRVVYGFVVQGNTREQMCDICLDVDRCHYRYAEWRQLDDFDIASLRSADNAIDQICF